MSNPTYEPSREPTKRMDSDAELPNNLSPMITRVVDSEPKQDAELPSKITDSTNTHVVFSYWKSFDEKWTFQSAMNALISWQLKPWYQKGNKGINQQNVNPFTPTAQKHQKKWENNGAFETSPPLRYLAIDKMWKQWRIKVGEEKDEEDNKEETTLTKVDDKVKEKGKGGGKGKDGKGK